MAFFLRFFASKNPRNTMAKDASQMTGKDKKKERQQRLAAALRENLRRRKRQARARQANPTRDAGPASENKDE